MWTELVITSVLCFLVVCRREKMVVQLMSLLNRSVLSVSVMRSKSEPNVALLCGWSFQQYITHFLWAGAMDSSSSLAGLVRCVSHCQDIWAAMVSAESCLHSHGGLILFKKKKNAVWHAVGWQSVKGFSVFLFQASSVRLFSFLSVVSVFTNSTFRLL